MVCCRGNISKHKRGRLDKLAKKGGQAAGSRGQSIEEIYIRRLRCKLATVLNISTHPVYSDFESSRMEISGRLTSHSQELIF